MPTLTVEIDGYPGLASETPVAAPRLDNANAPLGTGTVTGIAIAAKTGSTRYYVVTITYTSARPAGEWTVSAGPDAGSNVVFVAGIDDYMVDRPDVLYGINSVSVTIQNASNNEPIENASVRFYRSGQSETKLTDVGGEANPFGLDSATWNYLVSAVGFATITGTLVVSADDSVTYQLSPVTPSPIGTGNQCLCTLGVVAIDETPIAGAILSAATKDKSSFVGNSLILPEQDKPTSVDGVITVYLIRGIEYDIAVKYNRNEVRFSFTCPDASTANMGEVAV